MFRRPHSEKEEQASFINDLELNYLQERASYIKWINIIAAPMIIALIAQIISAAILWSYYPSSLLMSLTIEGVLYLLATLIALSWTTKLEKAAATEGHVRGRQVTIPYIRMKILFFLAIIFIVTALVLIVIVHAYQDWYEGYFQAAGSDPTSWMRIYGHYTVDEVSNFYRNVIQILGGIHLIYLFFFYLVLRTTFNFLEFKNKSLSQFVFLANTLQLAAGLAMFYFAQNLKYLSHDVSRAADLSRWKLESLSSVGLVVAALAFLVFFFNWRKWRIGFLVSGFALLVAFAFLVHCTGVAYRHAQALHNYYESEERCPGKLDGTQMAELTNFGCPSKYVIVHGSLSTNCSNPWLVEVWEQDLELPADKKAHQQGCLNEGCCGVLANLHTARLYIFSHVILVTTVLVGLVTVGSYYLWHINWLDYGIAKSNRDLFWFFVKLGLVAGFLLLFFGTKLKVPNVYGSQIAVTRTPDDTITPVKPEEIGAHSLYLVSLNYDAVRLRKDSDIIDNSEANQAQFETGSRRILEPAVTSVNQTAFAGQYNLTEVLRGTVSTEYPPGKLEGISSAKIEVLGADRAELASITTESNGHFSVTLPKYSATKPYIIKVMITAKGYTPVTYSSQIGGFPTRNTTELGFLELIKLPPRILPALLPQAPLLLDASDPMVSNDLVSSTNATNTTITVKGNSSANKSKYNFTKPAKLTTTNKTNNNITSNKTPLSATIAVYVESAHDGTNLEDVYAYIYLEQGSQIMQSGWIYPANIQGNKITFESVQRGNFVLTVKHDQYADHIRNLVVRSETTNITVVLVPKTNKAHALQLLLNVPHQQDFTIHANFDVDDTNICFITTLYSSCGGISKFSKERQYESLHVSSYGQYYYLFYVRQLKRTNSQASDDIDFDPVLNNDITTTSTTEKSSSMSSDQGVYVTASVSEKGYANSANKDHTTVTPPGFGSTHQPNTDYTSSLPRPLSKSTIFLDIYLPNIDKIAGRLYAPSQVPKNLPEDETLTWLAFCIDGRVGPRSLKAINTYWDPQSSTSVVPNSITICGPLYDQTDPIDTPNDTSKVN